MTSNRFFTQVRVLAFGLWFALSAIQAPATITFSLTLHRDVIPAYQSNYCQTWFYAFPSLSDTSTPLSHHRVESPTAICNATFGTNTDSGALVFTEVGDFVNQLTNGNWKLWLNRDTPDERLYTFTITSATLTSNTFGQINIITPRDGDLRVASNTPYAWTGPYGFDSIYVSAAESSDVLPENATHWNSGPVLAPGTNFFCVSYDKIITAEFSISTPTNDTFGLLTNWTVGNIGLESRASSGFIVAGLQPSALAQALDAPGLIWETSGQTNWFPQTAITRDGVSAARSGAVGDGESTTLGTLIYGTNTITFWWKADSEASADYVEFSDNGSYVEDLTGDTGWQKFTYQLSPGAAHWLTWTYHKDWADAEGADAVFLDQVRLAGDPGFSEGEPLTFSLSLSRQQSDAFQQFGANQTWFVAAPSISGPTNPISYHRVAAPNNFCSANFGLTNNQSVLGFKPDFDEFISKLTNGNWKVWLNKETPQEELHTFRLTALNFSSNDLGVVTITSPLNGATNISAAPFYEWSGPTNWDYLFIAATQERFGTNYEYGHDFPASSATFWIAAPNLVPRTNHFLVRYQSSATTNFAVTKPFMNWTLGDITFESSASSGFIVTNAIPTPLLNAQQIGSDFQFEFASDSGRSYVIQSCLDLQLGVWETRTNLVGNGSLQTVAFPLSSEPTEFFRIVTQ